MAFTSAKDEEKVFLTSTTHGGETHALAAGLACIEEFKNKKFFNFGCYLDFDNDYRTNLEFISRPGTNRNTTAGTRCFLFLSEIPVTTWINRY